MPPVTATPLAPVIAHEDFLQRFGDWIKGLFNEADNLYNKLTDEEKKAAVWGSGIIAIVNNDLNALPPDVIKLFNNAFPDLSLDVVHGFIDEVLNKINFVVAETPVTLEDAIAALQAYLKTHQGTFWEQASAAAANIITILFSPETAFQKIVGVGEYVYQLIVKPHVAAVVAATNTPAPVETPVAETLPPPAPEPASTVSIDTPVDNGATAGSPAPGDLSGQVSTEVPPTEQTDAGAVPADINSDGAQATVFAEDLIGKVITLDGVEYMVEAEDESTPAEASASPAEESAPAETAPGNSGTGVSFADAQKQHLGGSLAP